MCYPLEIEWTILLTVQFVLLAYGTIWSTIAPRTKTKEEKEEEWCRLAYKDESIETEMDTNFSL